MLERMKKTVLGDTCTNRGKTIKNNLAYNKVQEELTKASKITFLLDYYPQPEYQKNMEKLANLYMKTRDECGYNVDLEAINLVVAHKNALAEIKNFGPEQGENYPNARYPKFSNKQLAYLSSPMKSPSNLYLMIDNKLKGDFEVEEAAGGKKRKYKRKTNKRKTNKRKTNKRKTYKKRTKK
tara:strand:- start:72 stop:614 length:543 start_codon:yes stop_codon:yes gene_type:complete